MATEITALTTLQTGEEQQSNHPKGPEKRIRSCGVLPYSVIRGNVYVLLGKEKFDPKWRDSDSWSAFGGRMERGETYEEAAAREFYEETGGVVCSLESMKQRLQNGDYPLYIDVEQGKSTNYRLFLVQVPYKNYPEMYANLCRFLNYLKVNSSSVEKNYLKWFSLHTVTDVAFGRWHRGHRYGHKPKILTRLARVLRRLKDEDLTGRLYQGNIK